MYVVKRGHCPRGPLAIAMYAIGTQPLIRRLDGIAKQVWYADDSAAGSSLERLRSWWDLLEEVGLLYGYFHEIVPRHMFLPSWSVLKSPERAFKELE